MAAPVAVGAHGVSPPRRSPFPRVCGAPKRQGGDPCGQAAGWGTAHAGQGRCKLHGGNTPIKHGRYSTVLRPSVAEIHARLETESEAEQLNVLPEARLIRALAADYCDRYTELVDALVAWNRDEATDAGATDRPARPQRIPDLAEASRLLVDAAGVVDKIHRQRAANAISRADLFRVLGEMGRVVETHVAEPSTLDRIKRDWLAIRLG